jgi:hypothetical protein
MCIAPCHLISLNQQLQGCGAAVQQLSLQCRCRPGRQQHCRLMRSVATKAAGHDRLHSVTELHWDPWPQS